MRARVLGLALLSLMTVSYTVQAQEAASSPTDDEYARTAAVTNRPAAAARPAAPRVFQRQATFYIPFSVNQSSAAPVDVVLFVSADLGAGWDEYSRQPASQKNFLFRAARDGEYWFASRMVAQGLPSPAATGLAAELRIIVDTAPPHLTLDAKVEADGDVHVTWEAYDDYLLSEKVLLQYQTNPGQPWKPLQVDGPIEGTSQRRLRGETNFRPNQGAAIVTVRLEAKDSADNINELSRRLIVPLSIASPFSTRTPSETTTDVPPDPFAQHGLNTADTNPQTALPASPGAQPSNSTTYGEQPGAAWPSRDVGVDSWAQGTGQYASRSEHAGSPVAREASTSGQQQPSAQTDAPGQTTRSSEAQYAPLTNEASESGAFDLPAGERPRMTKARRFNLDYSIDAVGPAGVEKVELWVTRNGGRDWDLWDVDEDRESPLLVEVESEGIYGFRVVIVGKNGLASQTPRPGDLADLWVGVDSTNPVAEIESASYGKEEYAGHLDIRWTATDLGLGARPISLMFSDRPAGPWTAIASGLPNTGQYYWRVDSRVPEEFYLKMEVRDEAGNTCVHQLSEPIRSAGLTPRGRIRGIEPLAN